MDGLSFSAAYYLSPRRALKFEQAWGAVGSLGASVSMRPRGEYLGHRACLPTSKSSAPQRRHGSAPSALEALIEQGETIAFTLKVRHYGNVRYLFEDGEPLTDAEVKLIRRHARDAIRERLAVLCDELNADLVRLGQIHLETPCPQSRGVYGAFLEATLFTFNA